MAEAQEMRAVLSGIDRRIPAPRTPLIGRAQELTTLLARLSEPTTSIVTITGPGGVGKTRLALQLAGELGESFADGALFVPLGDVSRPDWLFRRLAQALNLPVADRQVDEDQVIASLAGRSMLIVLDNLEQIIDVAPSLARMVDELPSIKLLITSRIPLRVRGEIEYSLEPLGLPPSDTFVDLQRDILDKSPAVALLVQRAQAVDPSFEFNKSNASAVVSICARLDGLPLAIELAAARLKVLSPDALLARFDNRLRVLSGGARDLPERQQTLWRTIAWSYDLLESDERAVFRAISVFAQGFEFAAAAAVLGLDADDGELLDWIGTLVDQSLVRSVDSGRGQRRLVMLETIREFGLEQLRAYGEEEAVREAHARYFREFSTPDAPSPRSLDVAGADRLEREIGNIHQALRWYVERDDADGAVSIVANMGKFWSTRGYFVEGGLWMERAMSMIDRAEPITQVAALQTASWFSCGQRRLDEALERAEWALRVARSTGVIDVMAVSLNLVGAIRVLRGEEHLAETYWEEALAILPERHRTRASVLNNSAMLSQVHSDSAAAERLYYASIEALPDEDHEIHSGNAYINLAQLKYEGGDYPAARALFARGVRQFIQQHNIENLFHSLEGAAELEFRDSQPERAAVLLGWVDRTRYRLGIVPGAFSLNYVPVSPEVEAALGRDRYLELFDRGALLTDEEAAAFALAKVEPSTAPVLDVSAEAVVLPEESPLTPREHDVLRLVAQGKSNQEIANALFISVRTAQTHVTNILGKLDIDSRAGLAAYAVRHRLA
ncbi:LuxR C-terminal-related transcriptional regulator [soil metagenome]